MATTTFRPGDTRAEILRKILAAANGTPIPPPTPPPSAPVATAATNQTSTSFQANWLASTGATSYRLDVSTDIAFSSFVTGYNNLNVGNALFASVTGLNGDIAYYYRVRAENSGGTSANSNTITVAQFYDAEVVDWVSRVVGFGSSVSQTTKDAVNTFMVGLKSNNLRTKIKRMNVYAGATKAACQAPLIKDIGPVSDSFVAAITAGTWIYSETGAGGGLRSTGNDTLRTGVNANNAALGLEDYHIGVYKTSKLDIVGGHIQMGAGTTGVGALAFSWDEGGNVSHSFMFSPTGDILSIPDATHVGYYVEARNGTLTTYKNGASVGTQVAPGGSRPTGEIYVHNASLDGNPWPTTATLGAFGAYHFGTFITSGEVSTLNTLIQALQTSFGRQA